MYHINKEHLNRFRFEKNRHIPFKPKHNIIINDGANSVKVKREIKKFCGGFGSSSHTEFVLNLDSSLEEMKAKTIFSNLYGVYTYSEHIKPIYAGTKNKSSESSNTSINEKIVVKRAFDGDGSTVDIKYLINNSESILLVPTISTRGIIIFRGEEYKFGSLNKNFNLWINLLFKKFKKDVRFIALKDFNKIKNIPGCPQLMDEFLFNDENHEIFREELNSKIFININNVNLQFALLIEMLFSRWYLIFITKAWDLNPKEFKEKCNMFYKILSWYPKEYQLVLDKCLILLAAENCENKNKNYTDMHSFNSSAAETYLEPTADAFDFELIKMLNVEWFWELSSQDVKIINGLLIMFSNNYYNFDYRSNNYIVLDLISMHGCSRAKQQVLLNKHNQNLSNEEYLTYINSLDKLLLYSLDKGIPLKI